MDRRVGRARKDGSVRGTCAFAIRLCARVLVCSWAMPDLLACPFCRAVQCDETITECPDCELKLVPLSKLGLSYEAQLETWLEDKPEHRVVRWTDWSKGRGPLALAGLVGVALFCAPWVNMTAPEIERILGFELARPLGWMWACPVAWITLTATALSRRTVARMRGARVAAALFCLVPMVTAAVVLLTPPTSRWLPVRLHFDWGLYTTLLLGAVSLPFAVTFGGRVGSSKTAVASSSGR